MANRETYPASQSPLQGDISGPAGATTVTVTGLQRTPISTATPIDQQALVFEAATGLWTPASSGNRSIQVNGVTVSDDYDIAVNLPLSVNSTSPVLVNGA